MLLNQPIRRSGISYKKRRNQNKGIPNYPRKAACRRTKASLTSGNEDNYKPLQTYWCNRTGRRRIYKSFKVYVNILRKPQNIIQRMKKLKIIKKWRISSSRLDSIQTNADIIESNKWLESESSKPTTIERSKKTKQWSRYQDLLLQEPTMRSMWDQSLLQEKI